MSELSETRVREIVREELRALTRASAAAMVGGLGKKLIPESIELAPVPGVASFGTPGTNPEPGDLR